MVVMIVEVRLFAILRERQGADRLDLALEPGSTVADALRELQAAHAELRRSIGEMTVVVAVNRSYAGTDQVLEEGDEVALVPPVSGGAGSSGGSGEAGSSRGSDSDSSRADAGDRLSDRDEERVRPGDHARMRARLLAEPLSLDQAAAFVADDAAGAIVTFQGVTREVAELRYEAYAEMAAERIAAICADALERHGICRIAADHRTGAVPLGEPSVIVAASAPHRPAAFEAAREAIDRVKAEAPIWKQEVSGGEAAWVPGTPPPVADRRSGPEGGGSPRAAEQPGLAGEDPPPGTG